MGNQSKSLAGKKVIVLGGSSGIGFATAKAAANDGAEVIIVSSNQERIDAALKILPEGNKGYAIDLSQEENIKKLFEQSGNFDHMVYTAGESIKIGTIDNTVIEDARQFFNIRYWGAFAAVKYAAPHINKGGSITLTSGASSTRPGKGWALGSSICSAIEGFVRAMAVELAPIRVNSVVPGIVKTSLWSSIPEADRENIYQTFEQSLLVKRVGEADDIAQSYLYLMNQTFCTGQNIIVDGGGVLI